MCQTTSKEHNNYVGMKQEMELNFLMRVRLNLVAKLMLLKMS